MRAIGTNISEEVKKTVLDEGRSGFERAVVVKDSYITALKPIKNIDEEIIDFRYFCTTRIVAWKKTMEKRVEERTRGLREMQAQ
jgi:hypothetical protein